MSIKDKIRKIINYKYVKKEKDTLQKKALKCMIAFLGIMIMCTMLSRVADSMTIPIIQTEKPKAKTMVDEVKAQGRIVKNREEKISVIEGLKVDYVNVNVGSVIKVGDTIAELNIGDLESKVKEIKDNIEKDQKTLSRANEDYNRAIADKKKVAQNALNDLNTAKRALENYYNLSEEEKDPSIESSLISDCELKQSMYNEALASSNDTVDLDRTLQDIKDSLNLNEYNESLGKLQPLVDSAGKITSEKEGIVTSVFVENGGVTIDTIISLADKESGYKFVGQIEKSKRNLIKQGQGVALNLSSSGLVDKLTVDAITASQENPDYLDVIVMLPAGVGEIDDTGDIIISSKSKKYGTCVPLAALRQGDNGNYYILTVSEKETVLGTEKVAKKVEVRVEKKDGEFAAISDNSISRGEQVIVGSNKNVEEGDRVRLETE